jgi:hypothetical protein
MGAGQGIELMALDLGKFLTEVRKTNPKMALMFEQIEDAVNQVANLTGVDATQHGEPPNPPAGIDVKAASGLVHVTLTDYSERTRALHYFVEADTNPAFPSPHGFHLGASRGLFVTLPAKTDGNAAQSWYFRGYAMYPGSTQRSDHIVYGGAASPTGVSVGGTTTLTPLTSTGMGTANTNGQQGGQGFGTPQVNRAPVTTLL